MAARWLNWPIDASWHWRGTRPPARCSRTPSTCCRPVSDRILGTVLTQVDLSRLQFYDYYRSSAYLKPYGMASLSSGVAK